LKRPTTLGPCSSGLAHDFARRAAQATAFAVQRRSHAVGRYEKGPAGNGIARRVIMLAQLTLGPLLELAPLGIENQRVSIGNAGPKRAAEGIREQAVRAGMENSARGQAVSAIWRTALTRLTASRYCPDDAFVLFVLFIWQVRTTGSYAGDSLRILSGRVSKERFLRCMSPLANHQSNVSSQAACHR
jgi:hypothetical protein